MFKNVIFFLTANYIIGSQIAIGEGLYFVKTEINGHPSENNLKVWLFSGGKIMMTGNRRTKLMS